MSDYKFKVGNILLRKQYRIDRDDEVAIGGYYVFVVKILRQRYCWYKMCEPNRITWTPRDIVERVCDLAS